MTVLALAAVLGLAACSGGAASAPSSSPAASGPALPTTPASAPQRLSETGSSLMAPLFALWAPAYHAQFSQVNLGTASTSSGTGISSAAAGTTDIGASDAYLSPADVSKYANLVNIPLAVAALMVICHVPGVSPSAHLRLNGKVLARIFAGTITRWDDPGDQEPEPGRHAAGHVDRARPPVRHLGQHVPVHLLPERPGSGRLELLADRHHGGLARTAR